MAILSQIDFVLSMKTVWMYSSYCSLPRISKEKIDSETSSRAIARLRILIKCGLSSAKGLPISSQVETSFANSFLKLIWLLIVGYIVVVAMNVNLFADKIRLKILQNVGNFWTCNHPLHKSVIQLLTQHQQYLWFLYFLAHALDAGQYMRTVLLFSALYITLFQTLHTL